MAGRNINNLRYGRKQRGVLLRVKEESEEAGLKLRLWHLVPTLHGKGEKVEAMIGFLFLGSKITVDGWLHSWNLKMTASWKESYDKPGQCVKKQRHHFADKGLYSQSYSFSSSHVQMWELDNKEGRVLKNWYLTVVLEKTLEGPLDSKEIKPVNLKGNQPWILFGRLTLKLKLQYLAIWC